MSDLPKRGPDAVSRGASLGDALSGLRLLFEAMRLLRRNRRLWPLAAMPVALSVVFVFGALGLVVQYAGPLFAFLTDWLPVLRAEAWYEWLWIGPARGLLALLGYALFAIASGLSLALGFVLANVLAAPFLDLLSRRIEEIEVGAVVESEESGFAALVREGGRTVAREAQRLGFYLSVSGVLVVLGLLVPGGQIVAGPALTLFTLLFLPLDYSGYALDRRQVPFRQRRAWISGNLGTMTGFGAAAFGTFLIPGLNLLMLPVLVAAGTLLAIRRPPEGGLSATARGTPEGTPTSP